MHYELSIIIPTLNESGNIEKLVRSISDTITQISYEIIFVDDDSEDGTIDKVKKIALSHHNIRFIKRIGRRGLSSASIEGMMASDSKYIAVMDSDLQHDESLIPKMLEKIQAQHLDIVIASRFAKNSVVNGLSNHREKISKIGNYICNNITGIKLTDPLSGFFMVRREVINSIEQKLTGKGFKILLDILTSYKSEIKYCEIPMNFRPRHSGESKLDMLVILEFLILILDKTAGHLIPIRFLLFIMVGFTGLFIHFIFLTAQMKFLQMPFFQSQLIATLCAMTTNFFINNIFTYRDKRIKGFKNTLLGLLYFYVACSIGAFVNIQTALFLYNNSIAWWLSGFIGCILGSVWNYGITSYVTWRK